MNHCIYHIALHGQVDEGEVNEMSPLHLERETGDSMVTQFSVATDQSGLLGLMRHLHNLGYVFNSLNREQS
jgi:hypothetical protein